VTCATSKSINELILLHDQEPLDQLLTRYQDRLKQYPDDADTHYLIGVLYCQHRQFSAGKTALSNAIAYRPDSPIYHTALAHALRQLADYPAALFHYETALRNQPNHLSALNGLGNLYMAQQQYELAAGCYQSLLTQHDTYWEARFNLGLCLYHQDQVHAAQSAWQIVIDQQPNCVPALVQLTQLALASDDYEQAIALAKQAIDIHPQHAFGQYYLAQAYYQQQQYSHALTHYVEAFALDPSLPDIHFHLGCVYCQQRFFDNALKHWLQHHHEHRHTTTAFNIGVTYLFLGRYTEAETTFQSILQAEPNHEQALENLACTHLQNNQLDESIRCYQQLYQLNQRPGVAYILQALTAQATHENDASLAADYASSLFNQYAPYYDQHLVQVLQYQAPQVLRRHLRELNRASPFQSSLDLGCGTGLCGQVLAGQSAQLTGVDISENMLYFARQTNAYHRLICQDMLAFLTEQSLQFDLIVLADVLPYIGQLDQLIALLAQRTMTDGYIWLSYELTYEHDYYLQRSIRYAHHPDYVVNCFGRHGFHLITHQNCHIRQQNDRQVAAKCLLAQKL